MPKGFKYSDTAALMLAIQRQNAQTRKKAKQMTTPEKKALLRKFLINQQQKKAEQKLFNLVTGSRGWGRRRKNKTRKKTRKSRRKKLDRHIKGRVLQ